MPTNAVRPPPPIPHSNPPPLPPRRAAPIAPHVAGGSVEEQSQILINSFNLTSEFPHLKDLK